jgi:hypothetical protein
MPSVRPLDLSPREREALAALAEPVMNFLQAQQLDLDF